MEPDAAFPRPAAARHPGEARDPPTLAQAGPVALAAALTLLTGADLAADLQAGVPAVHLVLESLALILCLFLVRGTGRQLRRALRRAHDLAGAADRSRAALDRLGAEAEARASGASALLDLHFARWALTAAEREVALQVLRGRSYREVADSRATSEHTVRNQAYAVYRKAGVGSRAEMAAFFLEQLIAPREPLPRTLPPPAERSAG